MKISKISKSIVYSSILILSLLFGCKQKKEEIYPKYAEEKLERINQQLVVFDSMIALEQVDTFLKVACPKVDDIIQLLKLRQDTSKCYFLLAKAHRIKGACYEWSQNFDMAIAEYLAALKLFDKYRQDNKFDAREEADLLNYIGVFYQNVEFDPGLSNGYLLRSNSLNEKINRPIEIMRNWINMANSSLISKKLHVAKQYLESAKKEYKKLNQTEKDLFKIDYYGLINCESICFKNYADSLQQIGQSDSANFYANKALSTYKKVQKGIEQLQNPNYLNKQLATYLNIITLLIRYNENYPHVEDSINYYIRRSLAIVPEGYKSMFMEKFVSPRAFSLSLRGNPQAGVDTIEKTHQVYLKLGIYNKAFVDPASLNNAFNIIVARNLLHGELAKYTNLEEDWLKAIKAYEDNLKLVINVRKQLAADAYQEQLSLEALARLEHGLSYVYKYWKKNKRESSLNYALSILSNTKGLLLEQQLQRSRIMNYYRNAAPGHPSNKDFLFQKTMRKESLKEDQTQYEKTKEQYKFFLDTLSRSKNPISRRYHLERFANVDPTIEKVRALLPNEQTAIVDYQTIYKHSFALVITKRTSKLIPLPIDAQFFKLVNTYNKQLEGNSSDIYESARKLYRYLIRPLKQMLELEKINHLVILPDKHIANLPFEPLISEETTDHRTFLLDHFQISYHYSLSSWLLQKEILAKGIKVNKKLGCFVAAPRKDGEYPELCAALALPRLAEMSQKIAKKWGAEHAQSTRRTFMNNYFKYDIIQLTLHGCMDQENNQQPYLVFAPGETEKDRLSMQDIYSLSFNARIGILASCLTAKGKVGSGEGAQSIARAFLYGGCPRVIAGINSIPDQAGASILEYFYDQLGNGIAPVEALALAKRQFIQKSKNKHPSQWAGLVYFGDPNWVE